jgi:hypothetical protein
LLYGGNHKIQNLFLKYFHDDKQNLFFIKIKEILFFYFHSMKENILNQNYAFRNQGARYYSLNQQEASKNVMKEENIEDEEEFDEDENSVDYHPSVMKNCIAMLRYLQLLAEHHHKQL